MKKITLISSIALILLAVNIFWVWFFITNRPGHKGRVRPKKVITEKLRLNESQTKEYEKLIEVHQSTIQESQKKITNLKNRLYKTLQNAEKSTEADSLIKEIGNAQISIEHTHYNHFRDIKNLCKPEQLSSFNELSYDIAKLFSPPPRPMHEKH